MSRHKVSGLYLHVCITHLRMSMATNQETKKRGSPSSFQGKHAEFLVEWNDTYSEASRQKKNGGNMVQTICCILVVFPLAFAVDRGPLGDGGCQRDSQCEGNPNSRRAGQKDQDYERDREGTYFGLAVVTVLTLVWTDRKSRHGSTANDWVWVSPAMYGCLFSNSFGGRRVLH
jgi:hypothetical protein